MQDFTKLTVVETKSPNPSKQPKNSFFEGRLSKDNFWTLMFAVGMIVGSMTIGLLFALFPMILLVKKFNGITIVEDKFFNSEGKELDIAKQLPSLAFVFATTIIVFAVSCQFNINPDFALAGLVHVLKDSIIFFTPASFFMFKDCPITILFNFKIWTMENPNHTTDICRPKRDNFTPTSAYYNDPRFSYLPNNIFNRDRFK